jgi:hypothetical protein
MSRKDFSGGLDSLINETNEPDKKKQSGQGSPAKTGGKAEEMKAATFKYRKEHLAKLRALAYFDARLIQDTVAEALEDYFAKYEKANGKIKTR